MKGDDGQGGYESCVKGLEEAARILSDAGFLSVVEGGELTSFFGVEDSNLAFAYTAECTREGLVEVNAGIRGVAKEMESLDCEAREKLLRLILEVPAKYRVMIGMEDDILYISFPLEPAPARDRVGSTYAFSVSLAGWLADQLERLKKGGEAKPFEGEA